MSSKKSNLVEKLNNIVKQHTEFSVVSNQLFCNACNKTIKCDLTHFSHQVKSHLSSAKHLNTIKLQQSNKKQIGIEESINIQIKSVPNEFYSDICSMFVQTNTPLYRLNHPAMQTFLKKWTNQLPPDESTLRKNYLPQMFENAVQQIRDAVGDNNICLICDETSDQLNRYLVNILIHVLDGNVHQPMLLHSEYVLSANHQTISQCILNACLKLYNGEIHFEKLLLFISDQAPYMIKTGKTLKGMFSNMMHITCLAHALNLVCEDIRIRNKKVDSFVSKIKNVFVKCPRRRKELLEQQGICPPPVPVITRWCTWLGTVFYLIDNFDKIKTYINDYDLDDSASLNACQKFINQPSFEDKLLSLDKYRKLADSLKKLQTQGLSMFEQLKIISDLQRELDPDASARLESSLKKNPDFKKIVNNDLNFNQKLCLQFSTLTSVDVERSFSSFKTILCDNRCKFSEKNLTMYLFIHYNQNINDIYQNNCI